MILFYSILPIILIAIGFIAFKTNKARNTPYKQRSSSEQIIQSLTTKFNSTLRKLADDVRNPKLIKEELSLLLSQIENNLEVNVKDSLLELRLSKQELEDSLNTLDKLRANNKNKAAQFYTKYKQSNSEHDLKLSKQLMSQIKALDKSEENIKAKLKEIDKLEEEFEFNFNMNKIKLNDKKFEIITITSFKEPQLDFLRLDDLTNEYKDKVNKINIEYEVSKKVQELGEDSEVIYSDKELVDDLESLLK